MELQALPVDRSRQVIKDKVFENRVTLIIGATGCGKSTRVPQFLQEELQGKVLCSQPRRLAVVSIAKRVAHERGCTLGEFVGYRIGHQSVASRTTRLLFTTAGLLLEDVRANGAAALADFKCVVFDEVHERSVESDLALECLHLLMAGNKALRNLKLVLMSATADIDSFKRHFADIQPRMDVINISDASMLLRNVMDEYQESVDGETAHPKVEERYINHAVELIRQHGGGGTGSRSYEELLTMQKQDTSHPPYFQVGDTILQLAADMVAVLHTSQIDDTDEECLSKRRVILVFLPTYRALDQLYQLLRTGSVGEGIDVHVLHSTLDTEECVRSFESTGSRAAARRKVFIATSIAESSVTIPDVFWVIDTCVTNEVAWSEERQAEEPRVVWASRSQCRQRQGRTGRTGRGVVYRLMLRNRYMKLQPFEQPAMLLKPLRREALALMSGTEKALRDVQTLFSQCMSPPPLKVVSGALHHLSEIGATELVLGRWQASTYGRLLAAMPVSLESALLVIRGGQAGLLWESVVLAAILTTSPYPIKQPFGQPDANVYVRRYIANAADTPASRGAGQAGSGGGSVTDSDRWLANLAAFEFWQRCWCDPLREAAIRSGGGGGLNRSSMAPISASTIPEALRMFLPAEHHTVGEEAMSSLAHGDWAVETALDVHLPDGKAGGRPAGGASSATSMAAMAGALGHGPAAVSAHDLREGERRWCEAHYLVLPSLLSVAETVAVLLAALHHHRPAFVAAAANAAPAEYFGRPLQAMHACRLERPTAGLARAATCPADGQSSSGLSRHGTGHQLEVAAKCSMAGDVGFGALHSSAARSALIELLRLMERNQRGAAGGRGSTCRFFLSPSGCKSGHQCRFLHDAGSAASAPHAARDRSVLAGRLGIAFEDSENTAVAALAARLGMLPLPPGPLFCDQAARKLAPGDRVLLLGDGDMSFSASVAAALPPGSIIATSLLASPAQLLLAHPSARAQLHRLATHSTDVIYGIDATALDRTGSAGRALPWDRVRHVVWNFPHNGVDEDPDGSRELLTAFFLSMSRLVAGMQRGVVEGGVGTSAAVAFDAPEVHLTLCNDQYGRWGLEALARESFWFVARSEPFRSDDYQGYAPRRCTAETVHRTAAASTAAAGIGGETTAAAGSTVLPLTPSRRRNAGDNAVGDDGFEPTKAITYGLRLVWPVQSGLPSKLVIRPQKWVTSTDGYRNARYRILGSGTSTS